MYEPKSNEIFHVHTRRCGHAEDISDEKYIDRAISLGAKRIVFTDHAPFPGDEFKNRMKIEELPEYIETINFLKSKYSDKIEVLCGLEVEYLPSYDNYIHRLRETPGIDIMLLGQHFYEHIPGYYSFSDEDKSMEFIGLFRAMIQGIESNYFDVVAHPDRAFRRSKAFDELEKQMTDEFIDAVISKNTILLEKNYSSMQRKNQYREEFWKMLPSTVGVIYGYDAHSIKEIEEIWNNLDFRR